jgi:hypothetical protein
LTVVLESVVELGLLWGGFVGESLGFYLALLLASLSPVAFLLTSATKRWFGGALSDPHGIQPRQVAVGRRRIEVDMNLAAVVAALLTMGAIVLLYEL